MALHILRQFGDDAWVAASQSLFVRGSRPGRDETHMVLVMAGYGWSTAYRASKEVHGANDPHRWM
ncbi:MAG: hypothetical protein QF878_15205, partial [SAR202 cluster bacterium]|nr:hypothetical protein [SAR202 cluster bacterium]